jgi:hypothetical protein
VVGEIRIKSENAKFRMVSTSEGNVSLPHGVQELKKQHKFFGYNYTIIKLLKKYHETNQLKIIIIITVPGHYF